MACIYKHIRPDTNDVFYVGIGKKLNRAYNIYNRNKNWKNIVNKNKGVFLVEILYSNITWEEACQKEKEYIKKYGRSDLGLGTLCNLTDGGEGIMNLKHSLKTKIKISVATKNRFKQKAHCRKGGTFINRNSRRVVLINLKTYIIYKFNTLVEAALFLNTSSSRVRRACVVSKSINDYYLKFGDVINKQEIEELKNKMVYALSDKSVININKDYSFVQKKVINTETKEIFSSISEVCKKYGFKNSTLNRQLNGVTKNKTIFKLI
jgi:hypothetical protein